MPLFGVLKVRVFIFNVEPLELRHFLWYCLDVHSLPDVGQLVMYLRAGEDHVSVSGNVEVPTVVHGGPGDDKIKSGGGLSALLGESGEDHLQGGKLNDLLIGGEDSDRLNGSKGDDILIAGTTFYDADDAALLAILAEWNSGSSHEERVANLRTGGGSLGGVSLQKDVTVLDDGDFDKLTGSSGRDWFFFDLNEDRLVDQKADEEGD